MTNSLPMMAPTKGSVVPYLTIDGALKATDFYKEAFGAEVAAMNAPDDKGRTLHVHLYINGGSVMLSDFFPEHGHVVVQPAGFTVALIVNDIDAAYQRALDAGAQATMPPADMFWGDRYGQLKDPFGVSWAMNQPKG